MSPWRKHLESISIELDFAGNTIAIYRPFQFLVLVNLLFTCSSCFLLGAGIRVPNGLFLQVNCHFCTNEDLNKHVLSFICSLSYLELILIALF